MNNTANPNFQAANLINAAYSKLNQYIYSQLASQTFLKSAFDAIKISTNDAGELCLDLTDTANLIKNAIISNEAGGVNLLTEFDRAFKNLGLNTNSNYEVYYDAIGELDANYKFIMDSSDKIIYYGTEGNDSFDGTANDEFYIGAGGNDKIMARQGDDIIYGGNGNDYIDACEGNDYIDGGTGADTMIGGAGNDTYIVDNAGDVVDDSVAYADDRFVRDSNGFDTVKTNWVYSSVSYTMPSGVAGIKLTGTDNINATGNYLYNHMIGNSGNNVLNGGQGWNVLDGGAGADTMIGGSYGDDYYVDNVNDVIVEGEGRPYMQDFVYSTINYSIQNTNIENILLMGSDNLNATGNDSKNLLSGNSGNNLLIGYGGDDVLEGKGGGDTMIGGLGNDVYLVNSDNDVIIENANEGTDLIVSFIDYTLGDNQENIDMNGSAIYGTGNELDNQITGNENNNVINGGAGNDTLNGRFMGDDFYDFGMMAHGEMGYDTLIGGIGNDVYFVNSDNDVIIENANEGNDTVVAMYDYTLGNTLENLYLSDQNWEAGIGVNGVGNDLDNVIKGGDFNNILTGGRGNDTLSGYYGNDTYVFNEGDGIDTINETSTHGGNLGTDDKVKFGASVNKNNIAVYMSGTDLVIDYGEEIGQDKVVVLGQTNANSAVEKLELSDGTFISNTDVNQLIQAMSAYASENNIQLSSVNDVKNNENLMNLVANSWHS